LGRPRRRWEDNIKMDLQEVGGSCGDWMEKAQGRDRWRALYIYIHTHTHTHTHAAVHLSLLLSYFDIVQNVLMLTT
jgi:hypothetical protein